MRILVVEDEPKMADVLQRGLRRAGLAVDAVDLGEDALIRAGATAYDAIVLDARAPTGSNGFAFPVDQRLGTKVTLTATPFVGTAARSTAAVTLGPPSPCS